MLSHRYPKRLIVLVTRNNFITVTETLSDTYTHTHTHVLHVLGLDWDIWLWMFNTTLNNIMYILPIS